MGQVEVVEKEVTLVEQFARWFHKETKGGAILSKVQCAKMISRLKSGSTVTEEQTLSWISNARRYCEKNLLCTIINIPWKGWRVTKEDSGEVELYFCKSIKKTVAWAERTMDLQAISKRKYMREAIKEVFLDAEGNIKRLAGKKDRVFNIWGLMMEKDKELLEANGKLISKN